MFCRRGHPALTFVEYYHNSWQGFRLVENVEFPIINLFQLITILLLMMVVLKQICKITHTLTLSVGTPSNTCPRHIAYSTLNSMNCSWWHYIQIRCKNQYYYFCRDFSSKQFSVTYQIISSPLAISNGTVAAVIAVIVVFRKLPLTMFHQFHIWPPDQISVLMRIPLQCHRLSLTCR